jgi:hypothetical protein
VTKTTSHAPTAHALPQQFSYVQTTDRGDQALELLELKAEPVSIKGASPLELQKALIREVVLAKAASAIPPNERNDLRILKLDETDLPLSKVRNESGFRVANLNAIRRGKGDEAELVTVLFARMAGHREKLVPLVFAHTSNSETGWRIKKAVDGWCTEVHGAPAEELIESRTHRLLARFVSNVVAVRREITTTALILAVGFGAIRGGIWGISSIRHSIDEGDKQRQVEADRTVAQWNEQGKDRCTFIVTTLDSIDATQNVKTKGWLLNQIQLQHYDTVIKAIKTGETAERIEAAKLLDRMLITESSVSRTEVLWRSAGPERNEENWWDLTKPEVRRSVAKDLIQSAFKGQTDPEIRNILLRSLEKNTEVQSANTAAARSQIPRH